MSTTIDHNNYEAWLLDYIEGNLSVRDEDLLLDFLKQNPELCKDVDDITPFILKAPGHVGYHAKSKLKKTDNINELMIASVENSISTSEQKELDDYCNKYPELCKELQLFSNTKLQSNLSVQYAYKNKLKHNSFQLKPAYLFASAAVIVLIATLVYTFMFIPEKPNSNFSVSNYNIALNTNIGQVRKVLPTEDISPKNNFASNYTAQWNNSDITSENITPAPNERIVFASIPSANIQRINTQIQPVVFNYYEETLHDVAEYRNNRLFSLKKFNVDNISLDKIAALKSEIDFSSPIKLLRKTKEEILSQDLIADLRNLKNN